jgi:transketolase
MACKIRQDIIEMLVPAKSGHPGGSLSAADILAVLYFSELRIDPQNPQWPDRDRFVLSKGHAAPVLYAALAEKGYFPREELLKLRQTGHFLQGHPDMKKTPVLICQRFLRAGVLGSRRYGFGRQDRSKRLSRLLFVWVTGR